MMNSKNGFICEGNSSIEYLYNILSEDVKQFLKPMLNNNCKAKLYPCYQKTDSGNYVVRLMAKNFSPTIGIENKNGIVDWFHAVTFHVSKDYNIEDLYEFKE